MKTKIIPFDLETAKKIQAGEIEGRIVTNHDVVITLLDAEYRYGGEYNIPVIWHWDAGHNDLVLYNNKGECENSHRDCYLHIELPEETPKHEFKPFDRVLVRNEDTTVWTCAIFSNMNNTASFQYAANSFLWKQCIPYEGNEHLIGTTDKPE